MYVGSGDEQISVLPPVAEIFSIFGVSFPPAVANKQLDSPSLSLSLSLSLSEPEFFSSVWNSSTVPVCDIVSAHRERRLFHAKKSHCCLTAREWGFLDNRCAHRC